MKVALLVLTYRLAECNFLPYVSGIPFFKMWNFVLKALHAGTPNLFTAPILTEEDAIFLSRCENASAQIATDPGLLFATGGWDLGSYVDKIRLCTTTVHGHIPSWCCRDLDTYRKHVGEYDAVFEYWGGSF
ncbi:unnamed protein product [Sphacelaria rigidula]